MWKLTSCRMTCSAQRTRATRRMHVPRSLISRCGSRHDVDLPAQALLLTTRKLNTLGQAASARRDIIVVSAAQVQCMAVLCASAVLCAVHAWRPRGSALGHGPLCSNAHCARCRIAASRARGDGSCGCCSAARQVSSQPEQHPLRPGMPGRKHQRPLKVLTYTCADRGT